MSASLLLLWMMMEEEEEERRRREEEERRERREREERRRKEEEEERQRIVKLRKTSPVVYNGEEWQKNRCIKAISMQPSVQNFVNLIDETKPQVIEDQERKYDAKILGVGYEYEALKKELDNDIEFLNKQGISIEGSQFELSRIAPTNTNVAKPVKSTETFGSTFRAKDNRPIELNPSILSNNSYYEDRYNNLNPEELENSLMEVREKMGKYQRYAKHLGFLLRTKKYLDLEKKSDKLEERQRQCDVRKKEMMSFLSFSKEQLLTIKSYFEHLDQLMKISNKIKELFKEKAYLRSDSNAQMDDLTIKEIMSRDEYRELVYEVYDYIIKISSNDEETMTQAYELVKGEYPIKISRKELHNLIMKNMLNYTKEDVKEKKLS